MPNRRGAGFWKPSVFFWESRGQWAVEYLAIDEATGRQQPARKTFKKALLADGKKGTLGEQKEAAKAFADSRLAELKKEKQTTRVELHRTKLSREQLRQAQAAFAIFDQIPYRNKSLVEAVTQYRENLKLAVDSPQLALCVSLFLGQKENAAERGARSSATVRTLKQRLNNFVRYFRTQGHADIKIGEVKAKDIIAYLDARGTTARTRRNYLGDLANFFNDAANPHDPNRKLLVNPIHEVRVHFARGTPQESRRGRRTARRTPHILQIEEVKAALRVAAQFKESGVLGFVVAGLFLGLRPSESADLSKLRDYWTSHIKLDDRIVIIDNGLGKIGDRRVITIKDNAYLWLKYLKDHSLPISYDLDSKAGRKAFARFRARAFLGESDGQRILRLRRIPVSKHTPEDRTFLKSAVAALQKRQDVFRHSFGTNFYYESKFDANLTVNEMGNSISVFITHYRGLLHPKDSFKDYWNLKPADFGLV